LVFVDIIFDFLQQSKSFNRIFVNTFFLLIFLLKLDRKRKR